jgi:hypothetical protein
MALAIPKARLAMKGKVFICFVLSLSLGFFNVHADITTRAPGYRNLIEQEIARCGHKINFVNSRGENLRAYGRKAADQVVFYQNSKQQLVRDMVEESVGMQSYRINYFLIKAYKGREADPQSAILLKTVLPNLCGTTQEPSGR